MNENTEIITATLPDTAPVNEELQNEITELGTRTEELRITDQQSYEQAVEIGREITGKIKAVKEWFAPMKEAAHKAHKAVCDQEKAMLGDLEKNKKIIAREVARYATEQDQIRQKAETEAKILRDQERTALLEKAAELDAQGKTVEAEMMLTDAALVEAASPVTGAMQKTEGVQFREDYEIEVENAHLVPCVIMGVEIRPVDLAAVKKLAKATNGEIKIPGIRIRKVKTAIIKS